MELICFRLDVLRRRREGSKTELKWADESRRACLVIIASVPIRLMQDRGGVVCCSIATFMTDCPDKMVRLRSLTVRCDQVTAYIETISKVDGLVNLDDLSIAAAVSLNVTDKNRW